MNTPCRLKGWLAWASLSLSEATHHPDTVCALQGPAPNYVNGGYGLATFQMSTGINITVSVVIAAALAVALIAGYIRIRRQRRAHRVCLA